MQEPGCSDAHSGAWAANLPPLLTSLHLSVPDTVPWGSLADLRCLESLTMAAAADDKRKNGPPPLPASLTALSLLDVDEPSHGFTERVRLSVMGHFGTWFLFLGPASRAPQRHP